MGAVGKEVQAAKHSQAQAVQDVEYRFSQEFAKVFNNQVKLVSAAKIVLEAESGSVWSPKDLSYLSTSLI